MLNICGVVARSISPNQLFEEDETASLDGLQDELEILKQEVKYAPDAIDEYLLGFSWYRIAESFQEHRNAIDMSLSDANTKRGPKWIIDLAFRRNRGAQILQHRHAIAHDNTVLA